jgi:hypothetical protein
MNAAFEADELREKKRQLKKVKAKADSALNSKSL